MSTEKSDQNVKYVQNRLVEIAEGQEKRKQQILQGEIGGKVLQRAGHSVLDGYRARRVTIWGEKKLGAGGVMHGGKGSLFDRNGYWRGLGGTQNTSKN
ncbi:hypothetical protein ACFL2C_02820 [Patescibacteria group bacterium]